MLADELEEYFGPGQLNLVGRGICGSPGGNPTGPLTVTPVHLHARPAQVPNLGW